MMSGTTHRPAFGRFARFTSARHAGRRRAAGGPSRKTLALSARDRFESPLADRHRLLRDAGCNRTV